MEASNGCRSRVVGRSGQLCGRSANASDVALLVEPIRQCGPRSHDQPAGRAHRRPPLWSLLQASSGCASEADGRSHIPDSEPLQPSLPEFAVKSGHIAAANDDELFGHPIGRYPIVATPTLGIPQLFASTAIAFRDAVIVAIAGSGSVRSAGSAGSESSPSLARRYSADALLRHYWCQYMCLDSVDSVSQLV